VNPFEATVIRVTDPLSAHTRSVRKSLLIASVAAIFISSTGLVPSKISALGIEFSQTDRGSMLLVLGIVVGFMLISFSVAAAADFAAWHITLSAKTWDEEFQAYDAARKSMLETRSLTAEEKEDLAELERRAGAMWRNAGHVGRHTSLERIVGPISWARGIVEFVSPPIAGAAALVLLARAMP
jgi:hypothetical protein